MIHLRPVNNRLLLVPIRSTFTASSIFSSEIHSKSSSYPYLLSLSGSCTNIHSLKRTHSVLITHGLLNNLLCQTKLFSLYGSLGHLALARRIFDSMPNPDFYSCKVMIRWYFLSRCYIEVIRIYYCMRRDIVNACDNVLFSFVLKACSELRDVNAGKCVHCEVVKVGIDFPDGFVWNGLVDMYAKCGEVKKAREVFDRIRDKSVVCWTTLIYGYVQNDSAEESLVLFNKMREGLVEGNQFTLGSLITACIKLKGLHQGKWVHGYVIKHGFDVHSFLSASLIDMYVKCGEVSDARLVFDELCDIDVVSWTAMIVGYTQRGLPREALILSVDEKWKDLLPNSITAATLLSACSQLGELNLGRSIHGLGIKLGLDSLEDTAIRNALVDMYAKCHMVEDAHYIFETVPDKDVVSWNSIICAYSQNGSAYEALQLFHRMRLSSRSPDAITLVSVISACASVGWLAVGSCLHSYSVKEGLLSSNVYVGTTLLNFYAKCGDARSARMIFNGMQEKNTITWSAMIDGYGMQGDGIESIGLFGDMVKEQLKPNEVIFTAILSACSHTGMVGEGWSYFHAMCKDFNFVPSMKHYACMVDMLARAGRLEEASNFIESIPLRPDMSVFGAFLHGCTLHSRLDLGETAVKKMLDLHPDEACYYILMSNLYASDGRWGQSDEVRKLMKQRGLDKSPGHSVMEMNVDEHLPPTLASLG